MTEHYYLPVKRHQIDNDRYTHWTDTTNPLTIRWRIFAKIHPEELPEERLPQAATLIALARDKDQRHYFTVHMSFVPADLARTVQEIQNEQGEHLALYYAPFDPQRPLTKLDIYMYFHKAGIRFLITGKRFLEQFATHYILNN